MAFQNNCKNCFRKFLTASVEQDWNVWGKAFRYGQFENDTGCPCIDANIDSKKFTKWIEPKCKDAFHSSTHYTVIVERICPSYAEEEK